MNNKLTVLFVFLLLFCVLQVNSAADLIQMKYFKKIYFPEEADATRHVDTYYCTRDASYWLREVETFRTCFAMDPMFFPAFATSYAPRYHGPASNYLFNTQNNKYVDSADLVYYCGHGNNFLVEEMYGDIIWFPDVPGYGDVDMEFLLLQSCSSVPAPIDRPDWADGWWEHDGKGIFQGLHSVCSYRTLSAAGDRHSAAEVGVRLRYGLPVVQGWFLAAAAVRDIRDDGSVPYLASAVFYPGLEWDSLYSYGADPPRNAHWLGCWWEQY